MSLVVKLACLCKLGMGLAQLIRAPLLRRLEVRCFSSVSSNLCKVCNCSNASNLWHSFEEPEVTIQVETCSVYA
jgi:hypothetical protein